MSHSDHRLARLVAALPSLFLKDPKAIAGISVNCAVGATWVVSGETLTTVPASGVALSYNLRNYTLQSLAVAIDAVSGYDATVVGGVEVLNANTLVDQILAQSAATPAFLTYYTAPNYLLMAPAAVALDDFDDAFEDAVLQLDVRQAGGAWLDRWAAYSGLARLPGESDATYASRTRCALIDVQQNGFALVELVECSDKVTSAFVADNIYDGFTRADNSSTLGQTDTGQLWIPLIGSWGVLSMKGYASAPLAARIGFAADQFAKQQFGKSSGAPVTALGAEVVLDTLWGNLPVSVTFSTVATGARLIFRHATLGSEWWVEARSDRWALVKNVSGAAADMGTWVAVPANGDTVKVVLAGTSITVFVNGVSRIGPVTDAYNQTATKAGLALSDATAAATRFEDFRVGAAGTFILVATMAGGSTLQDQTNVQTVVNRYKASGIIPAFVFQ